MTSHFGLALPVGVRDIILQVDEGVSRKMWGIDKGSGLPQPLGSGFPMHRKV